MEVLTLTEGERRRRNTWRKVPSSPHAKSPLEALTLPQRQRQYAEHRARIFGENNENSLPALGGDAVPNLWGSGENLSPRERWERVSAYLADKGQVMLLQHFRVWLRANQPGDYNVNNVLDACYNP